MMVSKAAIDVLAEVEAGKAIEPYRDFVYALTEAGLLEVDPAGALRTTHDGRVVLEFARSLEARVDGFIELPPKGEE